MVEEMLLELLDERMKRGTEERERELLRAAAHLIKCKGCADTRLYGKDCSKCYKSLPSKKKQSSADGPFKSNQGGVKMAKDGERRARAKAIPQDGGVQRVETLKHHEVGLTVENQ